MVTVVVLFIKYKLEKGISLLTPYFIVGAARTTAGLKSKRVEFYVPVADVSTMTFDIFMMD
jgi:hypothetical protein